MIQRSAHALHYILAKSSLILIVHSNSIPTSEDNEGTDHEATQGVEEKTKRYNRCIIGVTIIYR